MDPYTPTVLSLCSGAGGLELGVKLGVPEARTVCYVEGEAYAAAQLAARMEDETMDAAPIWSDVKTFDPKPWRGCVDILTAGYPCQPFSIAGVKRGEKDPRHLWPYIKDIVAAIQPELCFFENVSHHLRLGFQQVHDDLRSMGYSVAAGLFTAEEVGATHKRERLFIMAHRESDRGNGRMSKSSKIQGKDGSEHAADASRSSPAYVADGDGDRCEYQQSQTTGKDDPERWAQRTADTIAGRDCYATEGFSLYETGSAEETNRPEIQDGENQLANTQSAGTRIDQREFQQRPCGNSETMADPAGARKRRETGNISETDGRPDKSGSQLIDGASQGMADTVRSGLERQPRDEATENTADIASDLGIPVWPPSPSNHERWEDIGYALKPAVHRMADGMAFRVDRLRLCGNGVVPLVAAYAFRTLYASLHCR